MFNIDFFHSDSNSNHILSSPQPRPPGRLPPFPFPPWAGGVKVDPSGQVHSVGLFLLPQHLFPSHCVPSAQVQLEGFSPPQGLLGRVSTSPSPQVQDAGRFPSLHCGPLNTVKAKVEPSGQVHSVGLLFLPQHLFPSHSVPSAHVQLDGFSPPHGFSGGVTTSPSLQVQEDGFSPSLHLGPCPRAWAKTRQRLRAKTNCNPLMVDQFFSWMLVIPGLKVVNVM